MKARQLVASAAAEQWENPDARSVGAVGYYCRWLAMATLPHSATSATVHHRRNGHYNLTVLAPELPYGTYPRLLLLFLCTQAVRTRSRTIEMGHLSKFLREWGLAATGGTEGTIQRLRQHCLRLFSTTFNFTFFGREGSGICNVPPVERAVELWEPTSKATVVQLSGQFFNETTTRPIPVDLRTCRTLARLRSPMAMDLYVWLTHRVSYLTDTTVIPWELLHQQFGSEASTVRAFRRRFQKWLTVTLAAAAWQPSVIPLPQGLQLGRSLPHVPFRHLL